MDSGVTQQVADFWQWWIRGGRGDFVGAIEAGDGEKLVALLSPRVEALAENLVWEAGADTDGMITLCISGGGVPALRSVTEQWRQAAPADDRVRFVPSRQPADHVADLVLDFGGRVVDFSQARFTVHVDEDHWWADVVVSHPNLVGALDDECMEIGFLILDAVLGEDRVEQWLGGVEVVPDGGGALDAAGLQAAVYSLAARAPVDQWVLLSADTPEGPIVVSTARPLQWLSAPLATTALVIEFGYRARPDGLPVDGELERLAPLEDRVRTLLPVGGRHVATVTRGGVRSLHAFVEPTSDLAPLLPQIDASGGRCQMFDDPGWTSVSDFR